MRTRMYGGVRGRKTKVGGKPTFVFLLLDYSSESRRRVDIALDRVHDASSASMFQYIAPRRFLLLT